MANLEHSTLTGSQLHEPKGAATALAGTAYLADGAGSGSFSTVPGAGQNVVTVNTLADFPTPVASVISLVDNTCYHISGFIDIGGNRFQTGINTTLCGNSSRIDRITSTTTAALFTGSTNLTLTNVGLFVASGSYLSLSGTGSENLIIRNCGFISCQTFGTITNWGLSVLAESFTVTVATNGLLFVGAHNRLSISFFGLVNDAGSMVDLGTATFNTVYIGPNVTFTPASGATGLTMSANSANINAGGRGTILANAFTGAGTPIVGYSHRDLLWDVEGNQGVTGTFIGGQGYILGSALNTTFAGTGSGNAVPINLGTAFIVDTGIEDQFTTSNAGRFTYIGEEDRQFFIDATLFANVAGGAARQYVFTTAINGTQVVASSSKREYTGSTPGAHSVSAIVELSKNDYIEIYVYAVTATTNLNVDTASIKIKAS